MEAVYKIAQHAISPIDMNADIRRSWLAKNPESCYIVGRSNKVVAYFHLLPLKHECLMAFVEGKIRGWNIQAEDIETFKPGYLLECLLNVASEPDVDKTMRKHYVRVLLRGLRHRLGELGKQGIVLTNFYATSETPTGMAMAIHAGMESFGSKLGKRLTFVLNVET